MFTGRNREREQVRQLPCTFSVQCFFFFRFPGEGGPFSDLRYRQRRLPSSSAPSLLRLPRLLSPGENCLFWFMPHTHAYTRESTDNEGKTNSRHIFFVGTQRTQPPYGQTRVTSPPHCRLIFFPLFCAGRLTHAMIHCLLRPPLRFTPLSNYWRVHYVPSYCMCVCHVCTVSGTHTHMYIYTYIRTTYSVVAAIHASLFNEANQTTTASVQFSFFSLRSLFKFRLRKGTYLLV